MSDIGDIYKVMNKMSSEKRSRNLISSTEILDNHNIEYESKNNGVHLIVKGIDGLIDFWPSTGKFNLRNGKSGRGVFKLIRHCR